MKKIAQIFVAFSEMLGNSELNKNGTRVFLDLTFNKVTNWTFFKLSLIFSFDSWVATFKMSPLTFLSFTFQIKNWTLALKTLHNCRHLTILLANRASRKSIHTPEVDLRAIFYVKSQSVASF